MSKLFVVTVDVCFVLIFWFWMPNIKQNIESHKKSTLQSRMNMNESLNLCNCRKPSDCPMNGNCLRKSIVYQATVTTEESKPDETYVGLTENTFKTRFADNKTSFNIPGKRMSTELSKYVWNLKDSNINFRITWKILKPAIAHNPSSKRCNLCLGEKYFIICKPHLGTLDKRNELVSSCRHASKFLLKNFKSSSVT